MSGRGFHPLIWSAVALGLAVPAFGASPGPTQRSNFLTETASAVICPADDPYQYPPCFVQDSTEVRAVVSLILDKDSAGWNDTTFVPNTIFTLNNGLDQVVPSDPSKSVFTVMVEFTHNGRTHVLSESYKDLGSWFDPIIGADCQPFCVPGWREPTTEDRLGGAVFSGSGSGNKSGNRDGSGGGQGGLAAAVIDGIRIQLATPGEAMRKALNLALGLPPTAVPYFAITDTAQIFDHSSEEDPLATVHRLKVNIKVLVAAPQ
jgi:hypothetical protein